MAHVAGVFAVVAGIEVTIGARVGVYAAEVFEAMVTCCKFFVIREALIASNIDMGPFALNFLVLL